MNPLYISEAEAVTNKNNAASIDTNSQGADIYKYLVSDVVEIKDAVNFITYICDLYVRYIISEYLFTGALVKPDAVSDTDINESDTVKPKRKRIPIVNKLKIEYVRPGFMDFIFSIINEPVISNALYKILEDKSADLDTIVDELETNKKETKVVSEIIKETVDSLFQLVQYDVNLLIGNTELSEALNGYKKLIDVDTPLNSEQSNVPHEFIISIDTEDFEFKTGFVCDLTKAQNEVAILTDANEIKEGKHYLSVLNNLYINQYTERAKKITQTASRRGTVDPEKTFLKWSNDFLEKYEDAKTFASASTTKILDILKTNASAINKLSTEEKETFDIEKLLTRTNSVVSAFFPGSKKYKEANQIVAKQIVKAVFQEIRFNEKLSLRENISNIEKSLTAGSDENKQAELQIAKRLVDRDQIIINNSESPGIYILEKIVDQVPAEKKSPVFTSGLSDTNSAASASKEEKDVARAAIAKSLKEDFKLIPISESIDSEILLVQADKIQKWESINGTTESTFQLNSKGETEVVAVSKLLYRKNFTSDIVFIDELNELPIGAIVVMKFYTDAPIWLEGAEGLKIKYDNGIYSKIGKDAKEFKKMKSEPEFISVNGTIYKKYATGYKELSETFSNMDAYSLFKKHFYKTTSTKSIQLFDNEIDTFNNFFDPVKFGKTTKHLNDSLLFDILSCVVLKEVDYKTTEPAIKIKVEKAATKSPEFIVDYTDRTTLDLFTEANQWYETGSLTQIKNSTIIENDYLLYLNIIRKFVESIVVEFDPVEKKKQPLIKVKFIEKFTPEYEIEIKKVFNTRLLDRKYDWVKHLSLEQILIKKINFDASILKQESGTNYEIKDLVINKFTQIINENKSKTIEIPIKFAHSESESGLELLSKLNRFVKNTTRSSDENFRNSLFAYPLQWQQYLLRIQNFSYTYSANGEDYRVDAIELLKILVKLNKNIYLSEKEMETFTAFCPSDEIMTQETLGDGTTIVVGNNQYNRLLNFLHTKPEFADILEDTSDGRTQLIAAFDRIGQLMVSQIDEYKMYKSNIKTAFSGLDDTTKAELKAVLLDIDVTQKYTDAFVDKITKQIEFNLLKQEYIKQFETQSIDCNDLSTEQKQQISKTLKEFVDYSKEESKQIQKLNGLVNAGDASKLNQFLGIDQRSINLHEIVVSNLFDATKFNVQTKGKDSTEAEKLKIDKEREEHQAKKPEEYEKIKEFLNRIRNTETELNLSHDELINSLTVSERRSSLNTVSALLSDPEITSILDDKTKISEVSPATQKVFNTIKKCFLTIKTNIKDSDYIKVIGLLKTMESQPDAVSASDKDFIKAHAFDFLDIEPLDASRIDSKIENFKNFLQYSRPRLSSVSYLDAILKRFETELKTFLKTDKISDQASIISSIFRNSSTDEIKFLKEVLTVTEIRIDLKSDFIEIIKKFNSDPTTELTESQRVSKNLTKLCSALANQIGNSREYYKIFDSVVSKLPENFDTFFGTFTEGIGDSVKTAVNEFSNLNSGITQETINSYNEIKTFIDEGILKNLNDSEDIENKDTAGYKSQQNAINSTIKKLKDTLSTIFDIEKNAEIVSYSSRYTLRETEIEETAQYKKLKAELDALEAKVNGLKSADPLDIEALGEARSQYSNANRALAVYKQGMLSNKARLVETVDFKDDLKFIKDFSSMRVKDTVTVINNLLKQIKYYDVTEYSTVFKDAYKNIATAISIQSNRIAKEMRTVTSKTGLSNSYLNFSNISASTNTDPIENQIEYAFKKSVYDNYKSDDDPVTGPTMEVDAEILTAIKDEIEKITIALCNEYKTAGLYNVIDEELTGIHLENSSETSIFSSPNEADRKKITGVMANTFKKLILELKAQAGADETKQAKLETHREIIADNLYKHASAINIGETLSKLKSGKFQNTDEFAKYLASKKINETGLTKILDAYSSGKNDTELLPEWDAIFSDIVCQLFMDTPLVRVLPKLDFGAWLLTSSDNAIAQRSGSDPFGIRKIMNLKCNLFNIKQWKGRAQKVPKNTPEDEIEKTVKQLQIEAVKAEIQKVGDAVLRDELDYLNVTEAFAVKNEKFDSRYVQQLKGTEQFGELTQFLELKHKTLTQDLKRRYYADLVYGLYWLRKRSMQVIKYSSSILEIPHFKFKPMFIVNWCANRKRTDNPVEIGMAFDFSKSIVNGIESTYAFDVSYVDSTDNKHSEIHAYSNIFRSKEDPVMKSVTVTPDTNLDSSKIYSSNLTYLKQKIENTLDRYINENQKSTNANNTPDNYIGKNVVKRLKRSLELDLNKMFGQDGVYSIDRLQMEFIEKLKNAANTADSIHIIESKWKTAIEIVSESLRRFTSTSASMASDKDLHSRFEELVSETGDRKLANHYINDLLLTQLRAAKLDKTLIDYTKFSIKSDSLTAYLFAQKPELADHKTTIIKIINKFEQIYELTQIDPINAMNDMDYFFSFRKFIAFIFESTAKSTEYKYYNVDEIFNNWVSSIKTGLIDYKSKLRKAYRFKLTDDSEMFNEFDHIQEIGWRIYSFIYDLDNKSYKEILRLSTNMNWIKSHAAYNALGGIMSSTDFETDKNKEWDYKAVEKEKEESIQEKQEKANEFESFLQGLERNMVEDEPNRVYPVNRVNFRMMPKYNSVVSNLKTVHSTLFDLANPIDFVYLYHHIITSSEETLPTKIDFIDKTNGGLYNNAPSSIDFSQFEPEFKKLQSALKNKKNKSEVIRILNGISDEVNKNQKLSVQLNKLKRSIWNEFIYNNIYDKETVRKSQPSNEPDAPIQYTIAIRPEVVHGVNRVFESAERDIFTKKHRTAEEIKNEEADARRATAQSIMDMGLCPNIQEVSQVLAFTSVVNGYFTSIKETIMSADSKEESAPGGEWKSKSTPFATRYVDNRAGNIPYDTINLKNLGSIFGPIEGIDLSFLIKETNRSAVLSEIDTALRSIFYIDESGQMDLHEQIQTVLNKLKTVYVADELNAEIEKLISIDEAHITSMASTYLRKAFADAKYAIYIQCLNTGVIVKSHTSSESGDVNEIKIVETFDSLRGMFARVYDNKSDAINHVIHDFIREYLKFIFDSVKEQFIDALIQLNQSQEWDLNINDIKDLIKDIDMVGSSLQTIHHGINKSTLTKFYRTVTGQLFGVLIERFSKIVESADIQEKQTPLDFYYQTYVESRSSTDVKALSAKYAEKLKSYKTGWVSAKSQSSNATSNANSALNSKLFEYYNLNNEDRKEKFSEQIETVSSSLFQKEIESVKNAEEMLASVKKSETEDTNDLTQKYQKQLDDNQKQLDDLKTEYHDKLMNKFTDVFETRFEEKVWNFLLDLDLAFDDSKLKTEFFENATLKKYFTFDEDSGYTKIITLPLDDLSKVQEANAPFNVLRNEFRALELDTEFSNLIEIQDVFVDILKSEPEFCLTLLNKTDQSKYLESPDKIEYDIEFLYQTMIENCILPTIFDLYKATSSEMFASKTGVISLRRKLLSEDKDSFNTRLKGIKKDSDSEITQKEKQKIIDYLLSIINESTSTINLKNQFVKISDRIKTWQLLTATNSAAAEKHQENMKELEEFIRKHKTGVVDMDFIYSIDDPFEHLFVTRSDKELPAGGIEEETVTEKTTRLKSEYAQKINDFVYVFKSLPFLNLDTDTIQKGDYLNFNDYAKYGTTAKDLFSFIYALYNEYCVETLSKGEIILKENKKTKKIIKQYDRKKWDPALIPPSKGGLSQVDRDRSRIYRKFFQSTDTADRILNWFLKDFLLKGITPLSRKDKSLLSTGYKPSGDLTTVPDYKDILKKCKNLETEYKFRALDALEKYNTSPIGIANNTTLASQKQKAKQLAEQEELGGVWIKEEELKDWIAKQNWNKGKQNRDAQREEIKNQNIGESIQIPKHRRVSIYRNALNESQTTIRTHHTWIYKK
jgi:hypothetical protein